MTCGRVPAGRGPAQCCDGHVPDACCEQVVTSRKLATLYRDAGLGRALAADPRWTAGAIEAIEQLAATGKRFGPDDVRRKVGSPKAEARGAMGAVFASAVSQKLIRRVDDEASSRVSSHRRRVGVYVGYHVQEAEQETLEEATTNG